MKLLPRTKDDWAAFVLLPFKVYAVAAFPLFAIFRSFASVRIDHLAVMPDNDSPPSCVSRSSKLRLVLYGSGALCVLLAMVFLAGPRSSAYWAYSAIMMKPCTNAVFARAFESQVLHSIPAIRTLTVTPGFATAAAASAWSTNKAATGTAAPVSAQIRIMALGATPEEARNAANDAAMQLCGSVQRQYGGSAFVIQHADRTGRWLLLYELKLRIARCLNISI